MSSVVVVDDALSRLAVDLVCADLLFGALVYTCEYRSQQLTGIK